MWKTTGTSKGGSDFISAAKGVSFVMEFTEELWSSSPSSWLCSSICQLEAKARLSVGCNSSQ